MISVTHCPACGQPMVRGSQGGMCPCCLLVAGLPEMPTTQAPFVVPEIDELQTRFPDLQIDSLLGRGGMGAVYKVRQPALNRFAALKLLPVEADGRPGFRDRFQREARTLAALNHPHIVTVYEFGERNAQFYFLMEFVEGGDLGKLMKTRKLESREALTIVSQICEALQYAHEAGVVHRDIKPGNILLDARGQVKIADFGVAKLLNHEDEGIPASYVLGTPRYMAPEQHERPREVDHRADLYSLGVVLYEMLTGELPGAPIDPPSRHSAVSLKVDALVRRALQGDPTQRYQHASEIRDHVERVLTPPRRLRPWIAVSAGAAATGAAISLHWPARPPAPQPADLYPAAVANSLGMQFRPVPGTSSLFSIWETRVADWQAFALQGAPALPLPLFPQDADHPQTGVSLDAAEAFCQWLTATERAGGRLRPNEIYRLPTDAEWSLAVGLTEPEAATPAERHLKVPDHYPWGLEAPVPPQAGNYPDQALRDKVPSARVIDAYYDGYVTTSPVGRFQANRFGLFDLGGNVWELTSSVYSADHGQPALRGGAWESPAISSGQDHFLSSFRASETLNVLGPQVIGFRVVLAAAETVAPSLLGAVRAGDEAAVRARLAGGVVDLETRDAFGRSPLGLAIRAGNLEIARLLLEAGASPDAPNAMGVTPLHEAAQAGLLRLVELLLDRKAPADARTRSGQRPLHVAAGSGATTTMEALVGAGALVNDPGDGGSSPLIEALWNKQGEAAQWLLNHGASPHPTSAKAALSPLVMATLTGEREIAARLLAMGADAAAEVQGLPLISLPASMGNPDIVRLFLEHGADAADPRLMAIACVSLGAAFEESERRLNGTPGVLPKSAVPAAPGRFGPLMKATAMRFVLDRTSGRRGEVIRLLLAHGATLEPQDLAVPTPLMIASRNGEREAVDVLLEAGADTGRVDASGFTALHCALEMGHADIASRLLARGASVEVRTADGRSPLFIASQAGLVDAVDRLLQAGADIEAATPEKLTPLKVAALGGWDQVVERLLRGGASIKSDFDGPLHFAAGGRAGALAEETEASGQLAAARPAGLVSPRANDDGYLRCVRHLLDHGADPSVKNAQGVTPLAIAARHDAVAIAELLLDRGAPMEVLDVELQTPLHYCAHGNAARTAHLLLDRGAQLNHPLSRSSPLHVAASKGSVEVARVLRDKGADLNALNAQTATPLLLAIDGGQTRMVAWLLEEGADLEKRDGGWMTPLHRAVHTGSEETVRLLCEKGANVHARDAASATPLQYAESLQKPKIRSLLLTAATAQARATATPPPTR